MTQLEALDGRLVVDGLPFAMCHRCEGLIVLDEQGFAGPHATPCGAWCELSPHGDDADTCSGRCNACLTARTGCAGDPSRPCGRRGCPECGTHASVRGAFIGQPACGHRRSTSRMAWDWTTVTCSACWALAPAGERGAAVAVRSVRRALRSLGADMERSSLGYLDGLAHLKVARGGSVTVLQAGGASRRRALLAAAVLVRKMARDVGRPQ